ncbi:MAG: 1-acyl-sn-glycerol-3-phosphate acyltransferase [Gemmatimonadales bacterium]
MIYAVMKWITGIAIHWFYRDIRVVGREKIPVGIPLLIAVNHQNALVDSLIAGWVMPRRIAMTAKATLTDNPLIALLFKIIGVVPLRRASDEVERSNGSPIDRSRNAAAFREILNLLEQNGAALIFPEGKSHNETGLEPLKTGLARLALQARDQRSIRNIRILPLGLIFEEKGTPGTIVGVRIGEAIEMDSWANEDHGALTDEIARRLRGVSEEAGLPQAKATVSGKTKGIAGERLIAIAAWWGRLTHQMPVRIARNMAVRRSKDADQPAMLTIVFGLGLVLLTYAIHLAIVGAIVHSFWISALYLAGLLSGAYWAAFEQHPRRY